nr:glycosyltransferase [Helleborus thibetanus]
MENQRVVLYPSPAMGHLISMVELGKLILKHHPSFSVTILVVTPPYNTGSTTPYIDSVSKTDPLIHFHHLPTVHIPLDSPSKTAHMEDLAFQLLRLNNPLVHQALLTFSETSTVKALVIDGFCTPALEVANHLDIPCYFFFTSGISILALFLHFPTIHDHTTKSFKDLKTVCYIPGLPPIEACDMPQPCLDRTDKVYGYFLNLARQLSKADGIIVNSFESLEPKAWKAISDGLCVPGAPTPPVFCTGPLIAGNDQRDVSVSDECLRWLDSQPSRSVVFLCFGSLGLFSEAQLKEIAIGLENSGQRFLWVVRSPPIEDKVKRFLAPPQPDLNALLPEGFLDRTKDRGLVVKTWAPQIEVLTKKSVGGFVTHCGWNSVLEAVCAGVPMVAWPLYAEQKVNRVCMVEEMRVALPMDASKNGFVKATEIEKRLRQLMESEEGNLIREQTLRMCDDARKALSESGSSLRALSELAEIWNNVGRPPSDRKVKQPLQEQNVRVLPSRVPKLGQLPTNVRTTV